MRHIILVRICVINCIELFMINRVIWLALKEAIEKIILLVREYYILI